MELALTFFLALIAPGAGQMYAGRYAPGVFFGAAFALGMAVFTPLCARLVPGRDGKVKVVYWANILYVCVLVLSVSDAVARCWAYPPQGPFPAGKAWVTLVFVLCVVSLHRNLRRPNLIDMLADMPGFSNLVLSRRKPDSAD